MVAPILAVAALAGQWALEQAVRGRVDAALEALAEAEAASLQADPARPVRVHEVAPGSSPPSLVRLDRFVQVIGLDGGVLARSANLGTAKLPVAPAMLQRLQQGAIAFATVEGFAEEPIRMVALPVAVGSDIYGVVVAGSLDDAHAVLRSARWLILALAIAVLGALAATSVRFAGRALQPIDQVVDRARQIGESSLAERLPHPGGRDELGRLVDTLNEMLARIERGVASQRRFTADASHELRSPLSRLRAELEITLRRPREKGEYEESLRSCLEEVERLSQLSEDLLTLARLEVEPGAAGERVALAPIVDEVIRRLRPHAERRAVRVVREGVPVLAARAATASVALAVTNLIDNAVKFSPSGGIVRVGLTAQGGDAVIFVSDAGPGIEAGEVPRVFDRFYRGTAGQAAEAKGFGLGLAISRAAVERHKGRIAAEPRPGGGATFSIRLPLAA